MPPAMEGHGQINLQGASRIVTLDDLIDHSVRVLLIDIIDNDVRTKTRVHQRVGATKTLTRASD